MTATRTVPPPVEAAPDTEPSRVLHVVLSLNPGGAERLVIDLSLGSRPEFAPMVCCLDERGAWARELDDASIPVHVLGREPGFQMALGRKIARLATSTGADVLHCHQYTPFVYGCLAKLARPDLHIVFTEHGRLAGAKISAKRRLANAVLGRCPGRFFAVCEELKRFMVAEGFPSRRLDVLYNGIDPAGPANADSRSRARQALGLSPADWVAGSVGRLDPVKDFPTLISAIRTFRAANGSNHSKLVIVGDGPDRAALIEQAAAAGLNDAVVFTGARTDVRDLLPAFDVYVNSSSYEGVSLTIIEAMAAALPVVATCVGGTPEVIHDGTNGRLVEPGKPEALAAALEDIHRTPARARELGAAGRDTVEQRFHFDGMLASYAQAYRAGVTA